MFSRSHGLVSGIALFFIVLLGMTATPSLAARTLTSADVQNGKYEEGLLGAAGTAGDIHGGQQKTVQQPLSLQKGQLRIVRMTALGRTVLQRVAQWPNRFEYRWAEFTANLRIHFDWH